MEIMKSYRLLKIVVVRQQFIAKKSLPTDKYISLMIAQTHTHTHWLVRSQAIGMRTPPMLHSCKFTQPTTIGDANERIKLNDLAFYRFFRTFHSLQSTQN